MTRRFPLLAVFSLLAAVSAAQDGPQPTFKSGVDLVRFDVRVVDGEGRPVTDLRPDEIAITDAGDAVPIVLFQRVSEPAGNYAEEAVRATTAEVSSNAAFPRGHLYILIFDQQHITPGNEQRARMAAESFIRRRVRSSDRVALYAVPGPGPHIGFTSDKARAIEALVTIRGSLDRQVATPLGSITAYEAHRVLQGDTALMSALSMRMGADAGDVVTGGLTGAGRGATGAGEAEGIARSVLIQNAQAVVSQSDGESRQFLQRLADVIAGLRDIEGRKTVVLFSEGFIQDNLSRELEAVAAAAAQSYCVFYTMDLNQRTPSLAEAVTSEGALGTELQARIAPLATLAVETDGAMIVDASARTAAELDKIADAAQDYYLVGFTPPSGARAAPGKYRRVAVKVSRPGARVSARTGYAVPASAAAPAPADRRRAIDRLVAAPFVQQGLKVDYTTYLLKGAERGRQRVVLSLSADLPVRSSRDDTADVMFVVRDVRDGRVVESGTGIMPLPASARPDAPLGTGAWRVQFSVPPGTYLMRSVVREPGGLAGSADRRLEVRALDAPDVTVSDMIIASAISGLPVRPRAYTSSGLSALLETYARVPAQLDALDVQLDLRREADNVSVSTVQADLLPAEQDLTGARRRVQVLMPLEQVAPGNYIARAVVRSRGEVIGERTRQVEILAGTLPAADHAAASNTWTPLDVIHGDLARRYIGWLGERAKGTAHAPAAALAAANRWEQLELTLQQSAADGIVAHALKGLALFAGERYAAAAESLRKAREAAPENALTAFFLGWAEDGAGDSRSALSAWRSAVHLDPMLVSAHLALADGYLKISEPALAVQALRAGLVKLPASAELQMRLEQIERLRQ